MSGKLSRRKVASLVAKRLTAGDKNVINNLAAYLIETKQTRQTDLIVREIEEALIAEGKLVADVTSAHELGADIKKQIEGFLMSQTGVKQVTARYKTDASLIGGVKITTPQATLDTSIKGKLQRLKAAKK